jgi:hypothetical protein
MISWGIALMCNAAVKNKGGLYTTRFLLGLVRAMGASVKISSRILDMILSPAVLFTDTTIGRGWTVPRCYSPDDILVSTR